MKLKQLSLRSHHRKSKVKALYFRDEGATNDPSSKLLLRIYGPQVEHLIDRENELRILRRLARKRIGPRMLGTFINGRFEEFFHARTLKPQDLRDAATSRQIAKRMRELHEGIELLEEERDAGPFVWRNWDSWLDRAEKIVTFIDNQIVSKQSVVDTDAEIFKQRGYVCGTSWQLFKRTVERYRSWLDEQYGGADRLREQLVFAHNDVCVGSSRKFDQPLTFFADAIWQYFEARAAW